MHSQKKIPIEEVCRILELPVSSWKLQGSMNKEQAEQCLKEFKMLVKTQRRKLAKYYHPDKTGKDDSKIKQINNIVDIVNKMEIKIQRRPQNQWQYFHSSPSFSGDTATSTGSFAGFRFYTYTQ